MLTMISMKTYVPILIYYNSSVRLRQSYTTVACIAMQYDAEVN